MYHFIRIALALLFITAPAVAGGLMILDAAETFTALSPLVPDSAGGTGDNADSVCVTVVFEDATITVDSVWYNTGDAQCTAVNDRFVFFDVFGDMDGSSGVGLYSIVLRWYDGSGAALGIEETFTVQKVTADLETWQTEVAGVNGLTPLQAADNIGINADDVSGTFATAAFEANFLDATLIADNALDFATYAGTEPTVWWNEAKTGYSLSGTQTFNVTGNITGNLSGSVGSVTGAVGSVAGAVGSVTATTSADVVSISGDVPAADNFETMLDGTGGGTFDLAQLAIRAGSSEDTALIVVGADNGMGGYLKGAGTGAGLFLASGTGATGNALHAQAASTNGHAFRLVGAGTGDAISGTGGGNGGSGAQLSAGAGNGSGLITSGSGSGEGWKTVGGSTGNGFQIDSGWVSNGGTNYGLYINSGGSLDAVKFEATSTGIAFAISSDSNHAMSIISPLDGWSGIDVEGDPGMWIRGRDSSGANGLRINGSGADSAASPATVVEGLLIEGGLNGHAVRARGTGTGKGAYIDSGIFIADDGVAAKNILSLQTDSIWLQSQQARIAAGSSGDSAQGWGATGASSGIDTMATAYLDRILGRIADSIWQSLVSARVGVVGSWADSSLLWSRTLSALDNLIVVKHVIDGGANVNGFTSLGLTGGDDYWNNNMILIINGNAGGQITWAYDFTGTTDSVLLGHPLSTAPAIGDSIYVLAIFTDSSSGGGGSSAAVIAATVADTIDDRGAGAIAGPVTMDLSVLSRDTLAGLIDDTLTVPHGAGNWTTGGAADTAAVMAGLRAEHGTGSWQTGGGGTGDFPDTIFAYDSANGAIIQNARIIVKTTDTSSLAPGTNAQLTNTLGYSIFSLDAEATGYPVSVSIQGFAMEGAYELEDVTSPGERDTVYMYALVAATPPTPSQTQISFFFYDGKGNPIENVVLEYKLDGAGSDFVYHMDSTKIFIPGEWLMERSAASTGLATINVIPNDSLLTRGRQTGKTRWVIRAHHPTEDIWLLNGEDGIKLNVPASGTTLNWPEDQNLFGE